jgi:hypothetical protein
MPPTFEPIREKDTRGIRPFAPKKRVERPSQNPGAGRRPSERPPGEERRAGRKSAELPGGLESMRSRQRGEEA